MTILMRSYTLISVFVLITEQQNNKEGLPILTVFLSIISYCVHNVPYLGHQMEISLCAIICHIYMYECK